MPDTSPSLDPSIVRKVKASKRILVVDDEKDIAKMIQFQLQSEGYQTSIAYDGLEALEKTAEAKPDLIILDIMMPKVDGWVVCHSIKGNKSTKNTRIIILTAKTQFTAKIKGLYIMQADIYMPKPFELDELSCNVGKLLCIEEEVNGSLKISGNINN